MSNPEPHGFPQGDPEGGANWPFASKPQDAAPGREPAVSEPRPAFPAPAAPPAQQVPQYSQKLPPAEGNPLPAGAPYPQADTGPAFARPELVEPQPVSSGEAVPAAQPGAAAPAEPLAASPISEPVPAEPETSASNSENSPAAPPNAAAAPSETAEESTKTKSDTAQSVAEIHKSLYQQALTPWWLDALMALSLAGVMVFNGFGMSMWLRIGSLIVMVVSLILVTWYQGDAQEKSNTFLTGTLLGAVSGFLAGLIVVAASLYMVSPIPVWYPWVLWLVSGVLLYLTYRGFRDWVMRSLQKKSQS